MRIYTRGGDKGKTGIHGGQRVDKDDIRIEANGCLDELNSMLGWFGLFYLENMNGRKFCLKFSLK